MEIKSCIMIQDSFNKYVEFVLTDERATQYIMGIVWKRIFKFFSINVKSALSWIVYRKNYFDICFEAIQNTDKSNLVLQAWTKVYHQIFADWKVKTMWNLQKNVWYE